MLGSKERQTLLCEF